MERSKSLEERRKIKNKKPDFSRQESHKYNKLSKGWRKPRGRHSKLRLNERGHRKSVEIGFGSPKNVRFLHSSGLLPVLVASLKDLENMDKLKEGIVISKKLGNRKRLELIKIAKEKSLKILNIKNIDDYSNKIIENFEARKKKKVETSKEKEAKKKELERVAKEKAEKEKQEQNIDKNLSAEELAQKAEEEQKKKKKEKDDMLIHQK